MNEKKIVARFVEHLRGSLPYEIWLWKNYVLKVKGAFPRRPEIDLIICRKEKDSKVPPVFAAEAKYIRTTEAYDVSPSYYSGLDEALALLILGFDGVMLIHFVEESVLPTVFLDYAKLLSNMIRSLKLPIGYRVYSVASSGDIHIYRTVKLETGDVYNLEELWIPPPPNPLLNDNSRLGDIVRRNRKVLVDTLGIKEGHPY